MAYDTEVLADTPLAYWRLQEASGATMADSSGNARAGIYSGFAAGSYANASLLFDASLKSLNFDGTNDFANITDAAWMDVAAITLEIAITADSLSGTRRIISRDDGGSNRMWSLSVVGSKLQFIFWTTTTGPHTVTGATTLVVGQKYLVAATFDGTNGKVFLDGVEDATLSVSGSLQVGTLAPHIGTQPGGTNWFDGRMQEVAYYGTALSAARLLAHQRAGFAQSVVVPPLVMSLSLPAPEPRYPITLVIPPFPLSLSLPAPPVPDIADPDWDAVEQAIWVDLEDEADVPADQVDPVVLEDLAGYGMLRRISETYPAPTLDSATGRPVDWAPTSIVDEVWGLVGIVIDGVHVETVRGVPTVVEDLAWQEPFGEGPGGLLIRGASQWDYGITGFDWMQPEANVDLNRYDEDGLFVRSLWSGIVQTVRWAGDGWRLGIEGAFAGPSGMMPHRPKLTEAERDWGKAMTYAIRRAGRGTARRKTLTEVEFGITTRDRGARSETLLEYVQRGLSMSQTEDGDQWTLARALNVDEEPIQRKYEWRLKDRDTVHVTLRVGQRGIAGQDLALDLAEVTRLVMGEGVNRDGGRWRNTKLPNVGKETVPPYPGYDLEPGMTNDDAVLVWQIEVLSDGAGDGTGDTEALTNGDYGDLEEEACRDIQERAGLPVTGVVDEDTWDATWSNGRSDLNLGGARFDPIWSQKRVRPFLYSSNGSVMAINPDWDREVLPIGRFVSYGSDVTRRQGRRSAHAEVLKAGDPGWVGTITLDGVDPPEMSRLDIREGMNVQLLDFADEPVLHIAGVRWARSGPSWSVTLVVDEKARDLLTLAQIRARNKEARQSPARMAIQQLRRSAQTRDTPAMWDAEGGFGVLPVRDASPGWNIYRVAAGKYGSLSRVRVRTYDDPVKFCVALFGAAPTGAWLRANVPSPLSDPGDDYLYWDRPAIQDGLRDRLFIEAFGAWQQAGGYSPGYETHPSTGEETGDAVTGLLDVDTSTDYALLDEPRLFVAVWVDGSANVKVRGQFYLLPNE